MVKTSLMKSNTLTLGASGDTIALASGASQSGFGRTGTVDWQTGSIKTAIFFYCSSGEGYFAEYNRWIFTMPIYQQVVLEILYLLQIMQ